MSGRQIDVHFLNFYPRDLQRVIRLVEIESFSPFFPAFFPDDLGLILIGGFNAENNTFQVPEPVMKFTTFCV